MVCTTYFPFQNLAKYSILKSGFCPLSYKKIVSSSSVTCNKTVKRRENWMLIFIKWHAQFKEFLDAWKTLSSSPPSMVSYNQEGHLINYNVFSNHLLELKLHRFKITRRDRLPRNRIWWVLVTKFSPIPFDLPVKLAHCNLFHQKSVHAARDAQFVVVLCLCVYVLHPKIVTSNIIATRALIKGVHP